MQGDEVGFVGKGFQKLSLSLLDGIQQPQGLIGVASEYDLVEVFLLTALRNHRHLVFLSLYTRHRGI